ncbi:MAG: GxxExxY protein [Gemmatimonadaceae bacterium]|nr:GxxExxY protein [Gemmatimonadaceae bacterium]
MLTDTDITGVIIEEAIRLHRHIGPGAFERVYAECLTHALRDRGLDPQRELVLPVEYRGIRVELGYRVDLLVNDRVIVEIKCSELHHPVYTKQLLTYLRLSNKRTGLLLNFGMERLTDGIHRVMNGWQ